MPLLFLQPCCAASRPKPSATHTAATCLVTAQLPWRTPLQPTFAAVRSLNQAIWTTGRLTQQPCRLGQPIKPGRKVRCSLGVLFQLLRQRLGV